MRFSFRGADYRLVALAALGPDLLDKPLAWAYFYRRYKSAVLFAHTLLAHAAVLLVCLRLDHNLHIGEIAEFTVDKVHEQEAQMTFYRHKGSYVGW